MSEKDIPAEAAKKIEYIQDKYDIFFKATNKGFWDYFVLRFNPYVTLEVKANHKVPFTLINELKKDFPLIER